MLLLQITELYSCRAGGGGGGRRMRAEQLWKGATGLRF